MKSAQLSDDPAAHVVLDAENPWPGLDFFSEESCGFFHGRGEEADLLLSMVRHRLLTVLYGQSGLGKSSLLQAGLFPRLRADGWLPVYIRLSHTDADGLGGTGATALIAQARQTIREAIVDALAKGDFVTSPGGNGEADSPFPRDDETLWQFLHRHESGLRTQEGSRVAPVLVFDQFEEIFTLGRSERRQAIRQTFLRDLADCVENRLPAEVLQEMNRSRRTEGGRFASLELSRQDYRIVLSLREDYLAELHDLSELMPSVHENETRLVPLNGWQALDAVSIPGEALIDPVVAREVVEIVAATRRGEKEQDGAEAAEGGAEAIDETKLEVDPALLSMVCRELNIERQRRNQPKITPQVVDDLLKKRGRSVLHRFYTECFSLLPDRATAPDVQKFIEDDLLTPAGYRNMAELARAQQVLSRAGVPDPSAAIQQLINQRLLRVNERRQDKTKWLELTHDVLCEVVKESRHEREVREAQEREERAEKERVARQLQEAERQRAESEEQAKRASEREASAMAKIKLMRHQRRLGIAALLCFLGALAGFGLVWRGQWKTGQKAQAEGERLVKRAVAHLAEQANDRRDIFALQHLSRALRIDPGNKEAARRICELLMENTWCPPLSPPLRYTSPFLCAGFTPQNHHLVAVSVDGNLVRWDARSFKPADPIPLAPPRGSADNRDLISSAAISDDGTRIVIALARNRDREENALIRPREGEGRRPGRYRDREETPPRNADRQENTAERDRAREENNARVFLWNEAEATYKEGGRVDFLGAFRSAAWSRDGNTLALFIQRERPVCLVFALEGNTYTLKSDFLNVTAGDMSADDRYLALGETAGIVQLRDAQTLKPLPESPEFKKATLEPEDANSDIRISSLALSGDGKEIAVATMRDGTRLWDVATATSRMLSRKSSKEQVMRVDYASGPQKEHRLAAGMNGMIALWDTSNLNQFLAEPICVSDAFIYPLFNPDGQKLITLTGSFWRAMEMVRVWDTSLRHPGNTTPKLRFDGKRAPAWLAELADAVTGTVGPSDDEDTPPQTLSDLRRKYAGVPFPAEYRPLWDRFLASQGNSQPAPGAP